jgi:hypothetical protein
MVATAGASAAPSPFPSCESLAGIHPFAARWRESQRLSEEFHALVGDINEAAVLARRFDRVFPPAFKTAWERAHVFDLFSCVGGGLLGMDDVAALLDAINAHYHLLTGPPIPVYHGPQIDRCAARLAFLLRPAEARDDDWAFLRDVNERPDRHLTPLKAVPNLGHVVRDSAQRAFRSPGPLPPVSDELHDAGVSFERFVGRLRDWLHQAHHEEKVVSEPVTPARSDASEEQLSPARTAAPSEGTPVKAAEQLPAADDDARERNLGAAALHWCRQNGVIPFELTDYGKALAAHHGNDDLARFGVTFAVPEARAATETEGREPLSAPVAADCPDDSPTDQRLAVPSAGAGDGDVSQQLLTASDLAKAMGWPNGAKAVSTCLSKYRKKHPMCAIESPKGQGVKKARYLYVKSAVWEVLQKLMMNSAKAPPSRGTPAEQKKPHPAKRPKS